MSAHLPAFPVPLNSGESYKTHAPCDGLTKRELIAAMAMQGILANPYYAQESSASGSFATAAMYHADALLAELAKEGAK